VSLLVIICFTMSVKNSHWCDEMGVAAAVNGNSRCEWEVNRNETWLNPGAGIRMGINDWEWDMS